MLDNQPRGTICIEDIEMGMTRYLQKHVTDRDIEMFADLTGDRNLLHFDPVYTKEKTKFKSPVAHGMLTTSFFSTLIGMTLPGKGSIITNLQFDFKKPIYVNDTIELSIEVTKKIPLTKHVFTNATITNQHSEVIAIGMLKTICST